jgi:hypothetical protein
MAKGVPGSGKPKTEYSFEEPQPQPQPQPAPRDEAEIIPPGKRDARTREGAPIPDPSTLKSGGGKASGAKTGPKSRGERIGDLATQLHGLHQLLSMMFQSQSLLITEKQAVALSGPVIDVAKKWGIDLTVDGWPELTLLAVSCGIYLPMALAFREEMAARTAKNANPAAGDPSAPAYGPQWPPDANTVVDFASH